MVSCDLSDDMVQLAKRNRATFIKKKKGYKEYEDWGMCIFFSNSIDKVLHLTCSD